MFPDEDNRLIDAGVPNGKSDAIHVEGMLKLMRHNDWCNVENYLKNVHQKALA